MRIAIHQPNYIPYLGFFEKFVKSDVFVILDHVQYTKNGFQNRNKIYTHNGPIWLTVPVQYKFGVETSNIKIDNTKKWQKQHLSSISQNYSKSPHFDEIMPDLTRIFSDEWVYLKDLNESLLMYAFSILDSSKKIIHSSDLGLKCSGSDLILEICQQGHATEYYSGTSGRSYLNLDHFIDAKIDVVFQDFKAPVYKQMHGNFIPNLAFIDFLFNEGIHNFKHNIFS